MRLPLQVLIVALSVAPGCEETLPGGLKPPPTAWEGEHFKIASDIDPGSWCRGTLPHMDDYVGATKVLFRVPEEFAVTYFLFAEPIEEVGVCPGNAAGCAFDWNGGGGLATDVLPHYHEIVHAVGKYNKGVPLFLEEGAASYWGGLHNIEVSAIDKGRVRDVFRLQPVELSRTDFALAADLTGFLVDSYGQGDYFLLREQAARAGAGSRRNFPETFERAMGLSWEDALMEYEEAWIPCDPPPLRREMLACEEEAIIIDKASALERGVQFEVDLSCDDENTIGPRRGADGVERVWQDIAVELDAASQVTHIIDFEIDDAFMPERTTLQVEVRPCNRSCLSPGVQAAYPRPEYNLPSPDPNRFEAESGRYVLRVSRALEENGLVRFWWR